MNKVFKFLTLALCLATLSGCTAMGNMMGSVFTPQASSDLGAFGHSLPKLMKTTPYNDIMSKRLDALETLQKGQRLQESSGNILYVFDSYHSAAGALCKKVQVEQQMQKTLPLTGYRYDSTKVQDIFLACYSGGVSFFVPSVRGRQGV